MIDLAYCLPISCHDVDIVVSTPLSQVSGLRRRSSNRIDAIGVAKNSLPDSINARSPDQRAPAGNFRHTAHTTHSRLHAHVTHSRTLSDISDHSLNSDTDRSSECSVDIDALSASSSSSSDAESESDAFLLPNKKISDDESESTTYVSVTVETSSPEAWYNRQEVRTAAHVVAVFVVCYGACFSVVFRCVNNFPIYGFMMDPQNSCVVCAGYVHSKVHYFVSVLGL